MGVGDADENIHFVKQVDGYAAVFSEQVVLELGKSEIGIEEFEAAQRSNAKLEQAVNQRLDVLSQLGISERVKTVRDAAPGRIEALPQRFQRVGVR